MTAVDALGEQVSIARRGRTFSLCHDLLG